MPDFFFSRGEDKRGPQKKRRIERKDEGGRQAADHLPTRSVLFVEYSEGSLLAKRVRETLARIEGIIGCKIKTVERSGLPLARQFPLTRLWEGLPCSRLDCVTCQQEGETIYPCTMRSVTYQNICLTCHPGGGEKRPKFDKEVKVPALYVGESARSLYERGKEHRQAYRERREDSHILKHQVLHHGGKDNPKFHLRPIEFHRTALNRQISEAVKISRLGEAGLLNSKGEFNRSRIARLSLGSSLEEVEEPEAVDKEGEENEEKVLKWEGTKLEMRRK